MICLIALPPPAGGELLPNGIFRSVSNKPNADDALSSLDILSKVSQSGKWLSVCPGKCFLV